MRSISPPTARTAIISAATENYDAVVLDLGLPEVDGLTVLDRWRKDGKQHAGAGADRARQLVGQGRRARRRRRRLSRQAVPDRGTDRPPARADPPRLGQCRRASSIAGDIRLDTRSGKVTKAGEPVKLTAQEYKLLSYLMHHKGKVVSRTELIEHIYDQDFDRDSNTIEVFVTRIRKKLGADVITTIRGLGYSLEDVARLNEHAAPEAAAVGVKHQASAAAGR